MTTHEFTLEKLKQQIRTIPDFPIPGIRFRDITPILQDGHAFRAALDFLAQECQSINFDKIIGIESRGFIFASALAARTNTGLVLVRKKGKLPAQTIQIQYNLEYGVSILEMHADSVHPGQKVLIIDDLLATGGTAHAAGELVRKAGGTPAGYVFLIELVDLQGRSLLKDAPVRALLTFSEDE